ncbi:MAG: class I SAM-dependent methyltransferase [Beijerinckiaceae bacterium]|nr:class I SAM-dependent methyltransferase [Beijerinckiaceae bacterium]
MTKRKRKSDRTSHDRMAVPALLNEQLIETKELFRPQVLRAMFMQPRYLEPSAWLEHIPFAFWLIAAHQPQTVVELGTHHGASYFSFCQAVQYFALDTQCYAVDHWKGDDHAGFYGEEVFDKVRTHNDANYSVFSRLVRSTFDEAVTHFSDKSIDLLHIDGFHSLEAIQHDFETWLPKLSQKALVLLHDSNVRERNFGIFKFVEGLRDKYPLFEFIHGHGLSVVAAGAEQNDLIMRLLESRRDKHFRQVIHEVFGRLGRACADAFAARQQQDRLREIQKAEIKHRKHNEELSGALKERTEALSGLQRSIEDNQCVREVAQRDAEELREALGVTRAESEQWKKELDRCKIEYAAQVQEKEAALSAARREAAEALEASAVELERLRREVGSRTAENEKLKSEMTAQIQNARSDRLALEQRLKERFGEIAVLTQLLQDEQAKSVRLQQVASEEFRRVMAALVDSGDMKGQSLLGRIGYLSRSRAQKKATLLKRTDLFDENWYLNRYKDVADAGIDPLLHYVEHGAREGREPNAMLAQIRGEV